MKQQNDKKARREANKPLQASRRARRCSRCKMASLADELSETEIEDENTVLEMTEYTRDDDAACKGLEDVEGVECPEEEEDEEEEELG